MKLFLALVGSSLGCGLYGPPPARVLKIIQTHPSTILQHEILRNLTESDINFLFQHPSFKLLEPLPQQLQQRHGLLPPANFGKSLKY